MARLAADGARPARPSPLPSGTGTAIEVERIVNAAGLVGLAGDQVNVGFELAGQRVTLRMDGTQMAIISHDGLLLRTVPWPGTTGGAAPAARRTAVGRDRPPGQLVRRQCSGGYPSAARSWSPPSGFRSA
jgi:hypothetical protein